MSLSSAIKAEARRLGFARVGILPAGPSRTHGFYEAWLARGYGGEMGYLRRHAALKADPTRWAQGARSVICLAARYPAGTEAPPDGRPRGRISRYARARDYHDVLAERLEAVINERQAQDDYWPEGRLSAGIARAALGDAERAHRHLTDAVDLLSGRGIGGPDAAMAA